MNKTIIDYFDLGNYKHLKAYQHLQKRGAWSIDFYEEIKNLEFPVNWQITLMKKMSKAYIDTTLNAMETGME